MCVYKPYLCDYKILQIGNIEGIFILMYTHAYIYIHINMYIHTHVCMCIYIYICIPAQLRGKLLQRGGVEAVK